MKGHKNIKIVSVREDRTCWHCSRVISKGSKCLTLNPKGSGRHWLCSRCHGLYKGVLLAVNVLDSTPFDDEGAACANADYLDEVVSGWEACQVGEDTVLDDRIRELVNH